MITSEELEALLISGESDRLEVTAQLDNQDKLGQAICAFANDLQGSGKPGYFVVGLKERKPNGWEHSGVEITTRLLEQLSDPRTNGHVLPPPTLTVEKVAISHGEIGVVCVQPSTDLPVHFKGDIWTRIGPKKVKATKQEEQRLIERRRSLDLPFDSKPVFGAKLNDISLTIFLTGYLPLAASSESLEGNDRTPEERLSAHSFYEPHFETPTTAGVLLFGKEPTAWLPGAYIQYARFTDNSMMGIADQQEFKGNLYDFLQQLKGFLLSRNTQVEVRKDGLRHINIPEYPTEVLRELILNAIIHRQYQHTNAPIRIYWFPDFIEIDNPGGAYGRVNQTNFDRISDYRNPTLASAVKVLGYIERFGSGIRRVKKLLKDNGNPDPVFEITPESFNVKVYGRVKDSLD